MSQSAPEDVIESKCFASFNQHILYEAGGSVHGKHDQEQREMSITLQNKQARRSKILRSLSLTITIIALLPAIALFAYDIFLYVITHPATTAGPFAAELIPLPITGWQAVAIQGLPAALIVVAIISIILDITGRWQMRKSQSEQKSTTPTNETARPQAARKPRRWGFSTWLALSPMMFPPVVS